MIMHTCTVHVHVPLKIYQGIPNEVNSQLHYNYKLIHSTATLKCQSLNDGVTLI